MNFEVYSEVVGETLVRAHHHSGLVILHHYRPQSVRTYASISTAFGSLDEGGESGIPLGTAHFLEHLLFEEEDGDVALQFSARGASCNAGTEHHRTSYQFDGVAQHAQNLGTLLRFVQQPHFPTKKVESERAIIEQEIRMYDDDPDWRGFELLLESLYHRHPIRNPIAGSVESIQAIDGEGLLQCPRLRYSPENLVLTVAGPVKAEVLAAVVDACVAFPTDANRQSASDPRTGPAGVEPDEVHCRRQEREMALSRPQLWMGFKDPACERAGHEGIRREIATRLLLELLFSGSSRAFEDLESRDLLDDGFEAFYTTERDVGFTILAAETQHPGPLEEALHECLDRARREGLPKQEFELLRRRHLGRAIRSFDSPEAVAGLMLECEERDALPEEVVNLVQSITLEELERRLYEDLIPRRCSIALLRPLGETL